MISRINRKVCSVLSNLLCKKYVKKAIFIRIIAFFVYFCSNYKKYNTNNQNLWKK